MQTPGNAIVRFPEAIALATQARVRLLAILGRQKSELCYWSVSRWVHSRRNWGEGVEQSLIGRFDRCVASRNTLPAIFARVRGRHNCAKHGESRDWVRLRTFTRSIYR
jgi:hypothetical protein